MGILNYGPTDGERRKVAKAFDVATSQRARNMRLSAERDGIDPASCRMLQAVACRAYEVRPAFRGVYTGSGHSGALVSAQIPEGYFVDLLLNRMGGVGSVYSTITECRPSEMGYSGEEKGCLVLSMPSKRGGFKVVLSKRDQSFVDWLKEGSWRAESAGHSEAHAVPASTAQDGDRAIHRLARDPRDGMLWCRGCGFWSFDLDEGRQHQGFAMKKIPEMENPSRVAAPSPAGEPAGSPPEDRFGF